MTTRPARRLAGALAAAALTLGLPVILIDRPPLPEGAPCLADLDAMLDWVAQL